MKKIKILTIIAAAAVVSAGLYSTPTFASELLDLNLSNVETNTSANSIKGTFEVTNNGDETINLSIISKLLKLELINEKQFYVLKEKIKSFY